MSKMKIEGYRVSSQQSRLWTLLSDSHAYRAQCAVRLEGKLDGVALRTALQIVSDRHEILRTGFQSLPGVMLPLQVVHENVEARLCLFDLTGLSAAEQEAKLEELFEGHAHLRLDVRQPSLFDFRLVILEAQKHVLLINAHPLCADAVTLDNLSREIGRAYCAGTAAAELPDQPVQYIHYSEWQSQLLEEGRPETERDELPEPSAEEGPSPELPFERQSNGQTSYEPRLFSQNVAPAVASNIVELATRLDVSVGTFILACWQTLLWRLTGQQTITTHVLYDGRSIQDLRDACGLFAKHIPIRSRFEADYSFTEILHRLNNAVNEARLEQDYFVAEPNTLLEGRRPETQPAPIGFDYHRWLSEINECSLKLSLQKKYVCIEPFKLSLSVAHTDNSITLEFRFDPARYTSAAITLLSARFLSLLQGAITLPAAPARTLPLLGAAERCLLLSDLNRTHSRWPSSLPFHELFAVQAAAHPQREAVTGARTSLSYGELGTLSAAVAAELRRRGLGDEQVVALCLGRTPTAIAALLGVLRAGCTVLPLDAGQPVERMQWALRESGARVALTRRGESAALDELLSGERMGERQECAGIYLEEGWEQAWAAQAAAGDVRRGGAANSDAERGEAERDIDVTGADNARGGDLTTSEWSGADARRAAYIIYTSGSTGRPKGVVVEHASLRNLCWALRCGPYAGLEGTPLRVSLNAPLSFDASVKQWAQLAWGHTLVFIEEEVRADAEALLEQVRVRGIEVLDCTPSQLGQLVEAGLGQGGGGSEPRLVLCGGEAVGEQLWREAGGLTGVGVYNVYGPTECTVDATAALMRAGGAIVDGAIVDAAVESAVAVNEVADNGTGDGAVVDSVAVKSARADSRAGESTGAVGESGSEVQNDLASEQLGEFAREMRSEFAEVRRSVLASGSASGEAISPPQIMPEMLAAETTPAVTLDSSMSSVPVSDVPAIGHPLGNVRVYLLDERGQLSPLGVPGELYIGGAGVARGYLHRPDLTAARFVPDPFSGERGARLYRTGDVARRLADGALEYVGRLDRQVKLRGYRIELGEVEAALLSVEGVRECAVAVRGGSSSGSGGGEQGPERLVAYFVAAGSGESAGGESIKSVTGSSAGGVTQAVASPDGETLLVNDGGALSGIDLSTIAGRAPDVSSNNFSVTDVSANDLFVNEDSANDVSDGDDAGLHRLPNGLRVWHHNRHETDYLYDELFRRRSYLRHGVRLWPGATVFDVGANIGLFALLAAGCAEGVRVFSFEPVPELYATLRRNARLAGRRVRTFPYGLGRESRSERFTFYPRYTTMSGQARYADAEGEVRVVETYLGNEARRGVTGAGELLAAAGELLEGRFEGRQVECRLRPLWEVLREEGVERIDLLKVDVQRAEAEVLAGLREEDWERVGQVVMEVHDERGGETEGRVGELLGRLRGLGFEAVAEQEEMLEGTDRYNLYAVREGWSARAQNGRDRAQSINATVSSDSAEAPSSSTGAQSNSAGLQIGRTGASSISAGARNGSIAAQGSSAAMQGGGGAQDGSAAVPSSNGDSPGLGSTDGSLSEQEWEALLSQWPARLAAWGGDVSVVSSAARASLSAEEMRARLLRRLPDYMVPSAFVRLERLPLTRHGKIDYGALPEPGEAGAARRANYVGPRTELERMIAGVWQKVLWVERVSMYENFFDLGGHSLLLVQAHRELCEKLGRKLSVTELFQHPTVESLARHLGGEEAEENLFEKVDERAQKYVGEVDRRRRLMRERRRADG